MHTSVNAEMHNVEHLSVNKLNTIKPLPVWKLNMECLHVLQKRKTLTNLKNHCSKAIIFRMLINQIVWELDSLCLWLRPHCRHFCLAKLGHLFSLYLIFEHAAQFPYLNPSCVDKVTNSVFSLGPLHILLSALFCQVCIYFCPQGPEKCRNHKDHSTF